MTRTTTYLVSLLLAFAVSPVDAQVRLSRIGVLGAPEEPRFSEIVTGLKRGLRERGYTDVEILEGRVPRGDNASERAVVEKMVQQDIKVLFAIGSRLVSQARQVSVHLPIIFITPGDPVASGLVASLHHPGGNTTGVIFEFPSLSGKRLELLKEMAPRVRRVLAIYDPRDDSPKQSIAVASEVAPRLGLTLIERRTRSREDVMQALKSLSNADAVLAIPGGQPTADNKEIIQAANAKRLPTIFHARTGSTMEALASYGANDAEIARQAARLVGKILKGDKVRDIPVEQPMKFEFVISLKTAKQIGLTIPPNVLVRADRVIR